MEHEKDTLAQVGIGMMIVFIGSLIAVTSSMYIMVNQLERITQSTEKTISVATKEAHTQIIFTGGWVDDHYDDYLFMIEYQSLGKEVLIGEVGWVLSCVDNSGNHHRRMGYLDSPIASALGSIVWEVGQTRLTTPTTLESGKRYFVLTDGGTGTSSTGSGGQCGPEYIHERGIYAYYTIYLPNGGHTTQKLQVIDYAVGESVT